MSLGVLAILSAVSVYALLTRRCVVYSSRCTCFGTNNAHSIVHRSHGRRIPPNSIVLSLTVLAVFTSTTLYVVSCVVYYQYDFLDLFLRSRDLLWSGPTSVHFDGGPEYIGRNIPKLQACLGSTTVTVNVRFTPIRHLHRISLTRSSCRSSLVTPLCGGEHASSGATAAS